MAEPGEPSRANEPDPTETSHDVDFAPPSQSHEDGAAPPAGGIVVHPPSRRREAAEPGASGSAPVPTVDLTEVATPDPNRAAPDFTMAHSGPEAIGSLDATRAAPERSHGPVPDGTTAAFDPSRTEPATDGRRRSRGPNRFPTVPGYEILEEIGRGGMGVVYKAHHKKMDIPVALKMVLAGAHASDEQLARFEDEARTLAQHRHPNIVQIYNVDEHDGLPYIALEFVPGGTLAQQIDGKPMDPRRAAEHARTLASAMSYAHAAGPYPVVHRDLKPANVLVTEDGALKITDFGLAKHIDDESGSGGEGDADAGTDARPKPASRSGSTRTGAVMGTPSYMAPEQAWGDTAAIGPASDQYSLGVILYEMLTGHPPHQAAHRLQTLELVRNQEPVPPTRLQPRIPRDLETICLRALQKEPAKRYPDCAAMAEDLRRYLANEPILARPVALTERAWRWCRRHPAIAGLSAAVASLGLVLLVGTTWAAFYFRSLASERDRARVNMRAALQAANVSAKQANDAAQAAGRARLEAEASRDDAARQTALALNTLNQIVGTTQARLRDRPDLQDMRRDLLALAEDGITKILRNPGNANRIDLVTAAVYQKIGEIALQTGAIDQALSAYTKMNEVVAALAQRTPDDPGVSNALAKVKNTLADLQLKQLGHAEVALALYQEGLALRQRFLEQTRSTANRVQRDEALSNVAVNHGLIADAMLRLGRIEGAIAAIEQAEAVRDQMSRESAGALKNRQERAGLLDLKGRLLLKQGQTEAGRAAFEESLALRDADARRSRDSLALRNNLYLSIIELGHFALLEADDPAEAMRFYTRARDGFQELREADRQNVNWTRNLAKTWYYIGEATRRLDQTADSDAAFRACLALREELAGTLGDAEPQKKIVVLELALAKARCGETREAVQLVDDVLGRTPTDSRLMFQAACILAQATAASADGTEAARSRDRAFAMLDAMAASGWTDTARLRTDPDLEPIRDDPRFAAVLTRMESPPTKASPRSAQAGS